jgi:hypothetical protein
MDIRCLLESGAFCDSRNVSLVLIKRDLWNDSASEVIVS